MIASIPAPLYWDASVVTGYTYAVRAFDAAGNTGPESSPLVVTAKASPACGLGGELALLLPALMWLKRRTSMPRR